MVCKLVELKHLEPRHFGEIRCVPPHTQLILEEREDAVHGASISAADYDQVVAHRLVGEAFIAVAGFLRAGQLGGAVVVTDEDGFARMVEVVAEGEVSVADLLEVELQLFGCCLFGLTGVSCDDNRIICFSVFE